MSHRRVALHWPAALAGLVLLLAAHAAIRRELAAPTTPSFAAKRDLELPRLGINLAALTYWGSEYPFVDVFESSQPFLHQSEGHWSLDEPLDLRPDGYPARLAEGHRAAALVFRDVQRFPAGRYVCTWQGTGTVDLGFAGHVVERDAHRLVAEVTADPAGILVTIERTDPADPVHDVHLVAPGGDGASPFHPDFLARWRGFGVLRFMDWQRTNGSPIRHWEDRTHLDAQTQASERGVAPEWIARLCNELDCDAWVCVPHRADDGYVEGLARLLATELEPGRRVWVEYSNETWNDTFPQAKWCSDRGVELGLSDDRYQARLRYTARRAVEIFTIFADVLGRDRLVRVLATQNANPAAARELLTWHDAYRHADVVAVAPYFGIEIGSVERGREVATWSVERVLAACRESTDEAMRHAAEHRRQAAELGLSLVAYEGGPHLAGGGGAENLEALTELLHAASRAPGMADVYRDALARWWQLGGKTFCAFNSTGVWNKWGAWGHAEDYGPGSEQSPKLRVLRRALAAPAAPGPSESGR